MVISLSSISHQLFLSRIKQPSPAWPILKNAVEIRAVRKYLIVCDRSEAEILCEAAKKILPRSRSRDRYSFQARQLSLILSNWLMSVDVPRYPISYQGSEYLDCLLFDNRSFCKHITGVLLFCCNRRIAEIGSIDLSYLL